MDTTLAEMPIIDIDTHLTEPPTLWLDHAPSKLKSRAPRVIVNDEGKDQWIVDDDMVLGPPGFCVIKPDGEKVYGTFSIDSFAGMTPGASYAQPRIAHMDDLGLAVQILYPNILGFAGAGIMKVDDVELRNFCISGYNDGVAQIQKEGRGRLYPQALLPFWDIDLCVKELERCKVQLGLSGFTMTDSPEHWGLPALSDPYWDPLWARAQEYGMPVNFHIGSGGTGGAAGLIWGGMTTGRALAAISTTLFMANMRCIINLIFSGLLDRFPSLNFVSVESGIGWLPFLLEACEYQMSENTISGDGLKLRPKEYFARQIYASFWFENEDVPGVIERLGADNIMFETDYPHPTCLYPGVKEQVQTCLGGLDRSVQRKILYENAARVYNIPLPDQT